MTVNTPEEGDSPDLRERLGNIPRSRLVDEVVSRWDDVIRLEGELINMRRRTREAEMLAISGRGEGSHVAELSGEFVLALEMGAVLEDIAATVHAHPTMTESFHEGVLKTLGHAIHIS